MQASRIVCVLRRHAAEFEGKARRSPTVVKRLPCLPAKQAARVRLSFGVLYSETVFHASHLTQSPLFTFILLSIIQLTLQFLEDKSVQSFAVMSESEGD